jgi:hypothetical protein
MNLKQRQLRRYLFRGLVAQADDKARRAGAGPLVLSWREARLMWKGATVAAETGPKATPFMASLTFKFAKTMAASPHEYVVKTWANRAAYIRLFHTIRRDGVDEQWGGQRYRYWYAGDGFKYWAMTDDVRRSVVINRAKVKAQ